MGRLHVCYLAEQNKQTKNGQQVYLDAINYNFRGTAVKDAILNQNMSELFSFKLTPNTVNGDEGYNNKFKDVVNTLQQQGHNIISPQILKSIYLRNIQDKTYIKDQACNEEAMTLQDIQSSILRKYLSVIGKRRRSAPSYNNQRFINNPKSSYHVQFDPQV